MRRKISKIVYGFTPLNRRAYHRIRPPEPISCVCMYAREGRMVDTPCRLINISRGGILLMNNLDKVYPAIDVEIRFQLPAQPGMISIRGEVLRTYMEGMRQGFFSAIKFKDEDRPKALLLCDYFRKPPPKK